MARIATPVSPPAARTSDPSVLERDMTPFDATSETATYTDFDTTRSRAVSYDEFGGKFTSVIDSNLFSGSSDSFRNSVGGYFFNDLDNEQNIVVPPKFQKMLPFDNSLNNAIYSITSYSGVSINRNIEFGQTGIVDILEEDTESSISGYAARLQDKILPYVKFVCHIEGNPTHENLKNVNTGNQYWSKLFTGGSFESKTVNPIYNDFVFDQHYTILNLPYEKIYEKLLPNGSSIRKFTEVTYKYNIYDKLLQNTISSFSSEKEAPNWYILNLLASGDGGDRYNEYFNYYGGGDSYLYDLTKDIVDSDTDSTNSLKTIAANMVESNDELRQEIINKQSNLLFNSDSIKRFMLEESSAVVDAALMPYYAKIKVDTDKSAKFVQVINSKKYSTSFLKTLKEVFLGQTNNQLNTDNIQFVLNKRTIEPSQDSTGSKITTNSEETVLRGVDFVELLLYSHNKILNENNDFSIMSDTDVYTKAAEDSSGAYRSLNVRNTLNVLNDTLGTFTTDSNAFSVSDIFSIMNLQNSTKEVDLSAIDALVPQPSYQEVLAYRVEKIAGQVSGDSNTQSVIQNFWIFNDDELNQLDLTDTQVKYGSEYTYKIYAYYIIKGVKNSSSDLQLTRIVGNIKEESDITSDTDPPTGISPLTVGPAAPVSSKTETTNPITGYCVEYYSPDTGDVVRDLLDSEVDDLGSSLVSSTATADTVRIRKSAASGDSAEPPYIANFVVTAQPSLKLVEVPIQTKIISVGDYIPNKVNIDPSYALDNSNKLIFNIAYQTLENKPYPPIIREEEKVARDMFLESNDMTALNDLINDTVSPARFVDIYRIETKPKSYEDFSGNLYNTIDNKVEDKNFAYKTCIFTDIVKSNTKYYYLFRTRNDLSVNGQVSQIIEAELTNDGGFKYATFNVVSEQDMVVEEYKNISETIKRIIQIIPNSSQLDLDDSEVDYSQSAVSQYNKLKVGSAGELIWNKTFKIRLTSKKTGKKIDLNITYNDPNVKLEE